MKAELISELGKYTLRPLGILQGISLLIFTISPIIFIWFSWEITLKIALTSFSSYVIIYFIYNLIKKIIIEAVDEFEDENKLDDKKSNFKERIENAHKLTLKQKYNNGN